MSKSWLLTFYSRLTNVFHNSFVLRGDKKGRPNILFRKNGRAATEHAQFNSACYHTTFS